MSVLTPVPEIYVTLGDPESAKKAVAVEVKAAEKLYSRDLDADDPNRAFKGTWPSTDLWRNCIRQAAKLSPSLADEIIAGIQDPDIATFEKVAYASALIGGSTISSPIAVSECHKNGAAYRVSF